MEGKILVLTVYKNGDFEMPTAKNVGDALEIFKIVGRLHENLEAQVNALEFSTSPKEKPVAGEVLPAE